MYVGPLFLLRCLDKLLPVPMDTAADHAPHNQLPITCPDQRIVADAQNGETVGQVLSRRHPWSCPGDGFGLVDRQIDQQTPFLSPFELGIQQFPVYRHS